MKNLLKKITPNFILRKINSYFLKNIKEKKKIESSLIPKFSINHETIENTKLLLKREDLLKKLPKNGIVAELGVDEGHFSKKY